MELTYFKNLKIKERIEGGYSASVEISDQPDAFFMPVTLYGKTHKEAEDKIKDLLGENCQRVDE